MVTEGGTAQIHLGLILQRKFIFPEKTPSDWAVRDLLVSIFKAICRYCSGIEALTISYALETLSSRRGYSAKGGENVIVSVFPLFTTLETEILPNTNASFLKKDCKVSAAGVKSLESSFCA